MGNGGRSPVVGRGNGEHAGICLPFLRREDHSGRGDRGDPLPVLRFSRHHGGALCRYQKARSGDSLSAGQEGGQGRADEASRREKAAAENLPGREPHRRDQGAVCPGVAVRYGSRRADTLQVYPFPDVAGQQVYLYGNKILFRPEKRHHGLRRSAGGRFHKDGGRSDGIGGAL